MQTPIKLNIYNKLGEITEKFIFIGNVDKNVENKLLEFEKTSKISKSMESTLKKYYGNKWKTILNIGYTGGFENSAEIFGETMVKNDNATDNNVVVENNNADDNATDNNIAVENENADKVINDIPDKKYTPKDENEDELDNITLEEINSISNIMEYKNDEPVEILDKKAKTKFIFEDFNILPNDNIIEFKKKISLATKIPIYKQNLWYVYNKKVYNLNYDIFINNKVAKVSIIKNIIDKNVEFINNIPILINFYNVKNLLKIKAYDTFSIINDIQLLGVTEFNLFNMDEFINNSNILSKNKKLDKSQIEIIYYGFINLFWPMLSLSAWVDYINTETSSFANIYPDLALNYDNNLKIYKMEKKITEEAMDLFYNKEKAELKNSIEKNIYISITNSIIKVQSSYDQNVINLRNLFDKLELNDNIISCKCSLLYKGKNIILNKTFADNNQIKLIAPLQSIMIRLLEENIYLDIFIFTNGNYNIKSKWPEERFYGFSEVFEIVSKKVNELVLIINNMGSYVINSNYKLEKMTDKNSKFSEIYVSLIYRKYMKFEEFKTIENILKEYSAANIVKLNSIDDINNTLQYYFSKGVYKFDDSIIEKNIVLQNYYNFLTNSTIKTKWQQLFQNVRNTTFQYRHGDIKISIEGIKEKEFDTFYMYILNIFSVLNSQKKKYTSVNTEKSIVIKKNIKTLKYQDPVLYDFKKLYNSPVVYSKICQKQHQPQILNEEEYRLMNDTQKEKVINYWNFTTKSPAYYHCPNHKYPFLQFIVKKHPKDYCIPCCRIKSIDEDNNSAKNIIYDACMKDHMYSNDKTNIISDTRYIMTYGKSITPGRICNLPEETVEPLLYESFSERVNEKDNKSVFYLYGIEQHVLYTKYVGYVSSLAFSLDLTIVDFINKTIKLITKNPDNFKNLLDGKIVKYFRSVDDLIMFLSDIFLAETKPLHETKSFPWNEIFQDIAYYYYNILSVIFEDKSIIGQENIKLKMTNKINSSNKILSKMYKILLIIHKKNVYNPIYLITPIVYFKTKIIDKKLFQNDVSKILSKIIEFENMDKITNKKLDITLDTYIKFQNSEYNKKKYFIESIFINKNNLCFYIEFSKISSKNKQLFYIPVKFSDYNTDSIINTNFQIKKFQTQFKILNEFIKDFNHWIDRKSVV